MSTALTEEPVAVIHADPPEPESAARVREIVSRGKRHRPGARATVCLALTSAALLWASFFPLDWGPLAWIALVPLLTLARLEARTGWMYRSTFLGGCAFWIVSLQWMRLGDPTMIVAWLALAIYLALYWPVFLCLTRLAVHRLGMPLVLCAPLLWVGLEYLRGHLLTGFSWYQLAHSQHAWTELIQISDLFGGYGVSFVIVAANAAIVGLIPATWLSRWKLLPPRDAGAPAPQPRIGKQFAGVGVSLGLVLAAVAYGHARRPDDFPLGPRVGLIQGNFVASLRERDDPLQIYDMHRQLTATTVSEQPDLIVWPEVMFPFPLTQVDAGVTDEQLAKLSQPFTPEQWRKQDVHRALSDLSEMTNSALIIGLMAVHAHAGHSEVFNTAALVQPGGMGVTDQYHKIHRVPFGEYIPFRESLPFLQSLTPFRGSFGIDQGERAAVFRFKDWSFVPTICFEDTVPHLVRHLAREAGVNQNEQPAMLVNISNDGWFHGSSELEQHLVSSQFRSIETRTPTIRAANTGISAVIDGDGVVREPVQLIEVESLEPPRPVKSTLRDPKTGRFRKQINAAQVVDVPLDPRSSLYVSIGDWFAAACLVCCVAVGLGGLVTRPRPVRP